MTAEPGQAATVRPGCIVVIRSRKKPWRDAEGLFLSYSRDGLARVLWYRGLGMTLHWQPKNIRAKKRQVVSGSISADLAEFVERTKRYLEDGVVSG